MKLKDRQGMCFQRVFKLRKRERQAKSRGSIKEYCYESASTGSSSKYSYQNAVNQNKNFAFQTGNAGKSSPARQESPVYEYPGAGQVAAKKSTAVYSYPYVTVSS